MSQDQERIVAGQDHEDRASEASERGSMDHEEAENAQLMFRHESHRTGDAPPGLGQSGLTLEISADGDSNITLGQLNDDESERAATENTGHHDDERQRYSTIAVSTAKHRVLFTTWWLEIVACITILAGLLALFGTLYAYMNRPSPKWPRWMSLNTVVSIYVTIIKTGVVLVLSEGIGQLKWSWFTSTSRSLNDIQTWDNATRGPVGAIVLLGSLHGRDLLASLGALLIVLVLAIDPFAQQLIHYYNCDVAVSGLASIPKVRDFKQPQIIHTGALNQDIVPEVINALNGGIFSPTPNPPFECTTGNCTWASEYSTLAWCSTCEDVSHEVRIVNTTFLDHFGTNETYQVWNFTTYIEGGVSTNKTSRYSLWEYGAMGPSPDTYARIGRGPSIDFLIGASPGGALNPSTQKTYPECSNVGLRDTWPCQGYGASRCTFKPCVKTFTAAVHNGQLQETLVDTNKDWGVDVWGANNFGGGSMLNATCLSSDQLRLYEELGYTIDDHKKWLPYNDTNAPESVNITTLSAAMARQNCLYHWDLTFENSITDYLLNLFIGMVTGYAPRGDAPMGNFQGPQAIQSIFNFGNVTFESVRDNFNNISIALTNYMRLHGVSNNTMPALGISQETKICIGIRWPWITYPAILVVLTLIFFVLLLIETCSTTSHPKVWKSSALALLYHGLEQQVPTFESRYHDSMDDIDQMEAKAKSTSVMLEDTGEGFTQFVEQRKKTS